MSSRFERIGSETLYEGGFFSVRKDVFRHEDGEEAEREIVTHTGAVGIVVLDGDRLWFVRQPREAIGSPDLLEIPAGKLDEAGEEPLETAKRELAEEIGKQADDWQPLGSFYTSPGFTDEQVHLFLATGISDVDQRPEVHENERIDVEVRPLDELEALIAGATDSKTIIGLARLQALLAGQERLPPGD
jgi:8-oxo-dGTP pyrophosphatase MutT (NUDIX family)